MGEITWMMVIGVMVLGHVVSGIISSFFKHREQIVKLKATAQTEKTDDKQVQLAARVEALEKQCAKLQEQVLIAHEQLADERRQLDNKLAAILPEISSETKAPRPVERSKTIG